MKKIFRKKNPQAWRENLKEKLESRRENEGPRAPVKKEGTLIKVEKSEAEVGLKIQKRKNLVKGDKLRNRTINMEVRQDPKDIEDFDYSETEDSKRMIDERKYSDNVDDELALETNPKEREKEITEASQKTILSELKKVSHIWLFLCPQTWFFKFIE